MVTHYEGILQFCLICIGGLCEAASVFIDVNEISTVQNLPEQVESPEITSNEDLAARNCDCMNNPELDAEREPYNNVVVPELKNYTRNDEGESFKSNDALLNITFEQILPDFFTSSLSTKEPPQNQEVPLMEENTNEVLSAVDTLKSMLDHNELQNSTNSTGENSDWKSGLNKNLALFKVISKTFFPEEQNILPPVSKEEKTKILDSVFQKVFNSELFPASTNRYSTGNGTVKVYVGKWDLEQNNTARKSGMDVTPNWITESSNSLLRSTSNRSGADSTDISCATTEKATVHTCDKCSKKWGLALREMENEAEVSTSTTKKLPSSTAKMKETTKDEFDSFTNSDVYLEFIKVLEAFSITTERENAKKDFTLPNKLNKHLFVNDEITKKPSLRRTTPLDKYCFKHINKGTYFPLSTCELPKMATGPQATSAHPLSETELATNPSSTVTMSNTVSPNKSKAHQELVKIFESSILSTANYNRATEASTGSTPSNSISTNSASTEHHLTTLGTIHTSTKAAEETHHSSTPNLPLTTVSMEKNIKSTSATENSKTENNAVTTASTLLPLTTVSHEKNSEPSSTETHKNDMTTMTTGGTLSPLHTETSQNSGLSTTENLKKETLMITTVSHDRNEGSSTSTTETHKEINTSTTDSHKLLTTVSPEKNVGHPSTETPNKELSTSSTTDSHIPLTTVSHEKNTKPPSTEAVSQEVNHLTTAGSLSKVDSSSVKTSASTTSVKYESNSEKTTAKISSTTELRSPSTSPGTISITTSRINISSTMKHYFLSTPHEKWLYHTTNVFELKKPIVLTTPLPKTNKTHTVAPLKPTTVTSETMHPSSKSHKEINASDHSTTPIPPNVLDITRNNNATAVKLEGSSKITSTTKGTEPTTHSKEEETTTLQVETLPESQEKATSTTEPPRVDNKSELNATTTEHLLEINEKPTPNNTYPLTTPETDSTTKKTQLDADKKLSTKEIDSSTATTNTESNVTSTAPLNTEMQHTTEATTLDSTKDTSAVPLNTEIKHTTEATTLNTNKDTSAVPLNSESQHTTEATTLNSNKDTSAVPLNSESQHTTEATTLNTNKDTNAVPLNSESQPTTEATTLNTNYDASTVTTSATTLHLQVKPPSKITSSPFKDIYDSQQQPSFPSTKSYDECYSGILKPSTPYFKKTHTKEEKVTEKSKKVKDSKGPATHAFSDTVTVSSTQNFEYITATTILDEPLIQNKTETIFQSKESGSTTTAPGGTAEGKGASDGAKETDTPTTEEAPSTSTELQAITVQEIHPAEAPGEQNTLAFPGAGTSTSFDFYGLEPYNSSITVRQFVSDISEKTAAINNRNMIAQWNHETNITHKNYKIAVRVSLYHSL